VHVSPHQMRRIADYGQYFPDSKIRLGIGSNNGHYQPCRIVGLSCPPPSRPFDGIPLHLVQGGHNREPCFFAEEDYPSDLHWLGEAPAESKFELHAYEPMTNHVHLLLMPKRTVVRRRCALVRRCTNLIS
ncbi:MAG: hypothetical protein AB7E73_15325, partial [Burkholderiales bacterium]